MKQKHICLKLMIKIKEVNDYDKASCEYYNLVLPVWLCTYVWPFQQLLCFIDITGGHRDQCCLWYMHSVYTNFEILFDNSFHSLVYGCCIGTSAESGTGNYSI